MTLSSHFVCALLLLPLTGYEPIAFPSLIQATAYTSVSIKLTKLLTSLEYTAFFDEAVRECPDQTGIPGDTREESLAQPSWKQQAPCFAKPWILSLKAWRST
jgi:hypothetical protein